MAAAKRYTIEKDKNGFEVAKLITARNAHKAEGKLIVAAANPTEARLKAHFVQAAARAAAATEEAAPVMNTKTIAVLEKRLVEREYGMVGTEAIVSNGGEKIFLTDGFGGQDDLRGGAVRWRHGVAVKLKSEDTFETLDAEFNVYFSVLDRALKAMDADRPLLKLSGRQVEAIAEKAGII